MKKPCSFEAITGHSCEHAPCDVGNVFGESAQTICCTAMIEGQSSLLQLMLYVTKHLGEKDPAIYLGADRVQGIDPVVLQLLKILDENGICLSESGGEYAPYADLMNYLLWKIGDSLPEFNG
jgi:hypothetical protein